MEGFNFSDEEIAKCKAAMDRPSPLEALQAIVSGTVTVSISRDGRDVFLETMNGRAVKDPDYPNDPSRRVGLAGAWPLFRAGLIDQRGQPTELGREMAKVAL